MSTVLITGNTYPVKDQIKALGGRWDADAQGWKVPAEKADAAKRLVAGGASSPDAPRFRPAKICKCGAKIKGNYKTCYFCSDAYANNDDAI